MRSMRCLGGTLLMVIFHGHWTVCQAQEFNGVNPDPQPTPLTREAETIPLPVVVPEAEREPIPDPETAATDQGAGLDQAAGDAGTSEMPTMDISDQELEYLMNAGAVVNENPPLSDDIGPGIETTALDSRGMGIRILGETITPGEVRRLHWVAGETLYGGSLDTPVYVIHGSKSGLRMCVTAAIHGDELNGVEIVRALINSIRPEELSGTLIGVPIVNLLGFTRGTRYLPDRRDLNRYFPGNARGSSASRIAGSFFEEVIRHCDRLVDLHTGSLSRTNLPQLRADLDNPQVLEFTRQFGSTAVLHSRNVRGNLRSAAVSAGIPAVSFELGEPGSLQQSQIDYGVRALETLMDKLDMIHRRRSWSEPQPVYYSSRWVRVDNGGLLKSAVQIGSRVKRGALLGTIINPLSSETYDISSPYNGRILGMSLNQFMLPGYAAFHIGIASNDAELLLETQTLECGDYEQLYEEIDCTVDLESDEDGDPDSLPEDLSPDEMEASEMDSGELEADEMEADEMEASEMDVGGILPDAMEAGESQSGEGLPDEMDTSGIQSDEILPYGMDVGESQSSEGLPNEMEAGEIQSGEILPDEIQAEEILYEDLELD